MRDPDHTVGLHDLCMISPNAILLVSFPSMVLDYVGVINHYFMTCLADSGIISRQKKDSY